MTNFNSKINLHIVKRKKKKNSTNYIEKYVSLISN